MLSHSDRKMLPFYHMGEKTIRSPDTISHVRQISKYSTGFPQRISNLNSSNKKSERISNATGIEEAAILQVCPEQMGSGKFKLGSQFTSIEEETHELPRCIELFSNNHDTVNSKKKQRNANLQSPNRFNSQCTTGSQVLTVGVSSSRIRNQDSQESAKIVQGE